MKPGSSGFSLIELIVSGGLFALVTGMLFAVLTLGFKTWRTVSARDAAQRQVRRLQLQLTRDIQRAAMNSITLAPTADFAGVNGGNFDGGIIWFQSNVDLVSGQAIRDPSAVPIQQNTVVYYLTKPSNALHTSRYGYSCQTWSGAGSANPDEVCPHKALVRLVLQKVAHPPPDYTPQDPPYTPGELNAFCLRPDDLLLTNIVGAEVIEKRVICDQILYFLPSRNGGSIEFDVRVARAREAEAMVGVGQAGSSLYDSNFTTVYLTAAVPGNQ